MPLIPNSIRRLVEILSRNRTLKRDIEVRGERYPIIVSPDAQLKYLKPGATSFDRDLLSIAETMIGAKDFVWDIGANIGVFSFAALAAHSEVKVLAVEPDGWLAALIGKSSKLSKFAPRCINVVNAAVSDEVGTAELAIASRGRASNALTKFGGRSQMGGVRQHVMVATRTIDWLSQEHGPPNFIKIDIEGAELAALKGAKITLSQARPVVYIETSSSTYTECVEIFQAHDYLQFNENGVETSSYTSNCFFIHRSDGAALERISRFALTHA